MTAEPAPRPSATEITDNTITLSREEAGMIRTIINDVDVYIREASEALPITQKLVAALDAALGASE